MNRTLHERWPWLQPVRGMRAELLALLSNADLSFSPGGTNLPWGALLRELGELEASYIQALQTFRQDFSAHATDVGVERDLTRLTAWFDTLDAELRATLAAFAEADWRKRVVRRGAPKQRRDCAAGTASW